MIIGTDGISDLGAVFPETIGIALIGFSVLLIGLILSGRATKIKAKKEESGGTIHRVSLSVVMIGWVFLMPVLGFFLSSLLSYFAIMIIADYDRPSFKTWIIWTTIGTAIVSFFWWVMANMLLLRMPEGILF
jgi:putative tricarboxylic transport membrane protein